MPIIGPHVGFKGGRETCEDMACIICHFISHVTRLLALFVRACGSQLYMFVHLYLFIYCYLTPVIIAGAACVSARKPHPP